MLQLERTEQISSNLSAKLTDFSYMSIERKNPIMYLQVKQWRQPQPSRTAVSYWKDNALITGTVWSQHSHSFASSELHGIRGSKISDQQLFCSCCSGEVNQTQNLSYYHFWKIISHISNYLPANGGQKTKQAPPSSPQKKPILKHVSIFSLVLTMQVMMAFLVKSEPSRESCLKNTTIY